MEQRGRTKHFLLAGRKMVDLKSLSILPEAHPLRRTDEVLLCLILTVQLDQDFLQISSCFHSVFPFISAAHIYTPVYAPVSLRQKRRVILSSKCLQFPVDHLPDDLDRSLHTPAAQPGILQECVQSIHLVPDVTED